MERLFIPQWVGAGCPLYEKFDSAGLRPTFVVKKVPQVVPPFRRIGCSYIFINILIFTSQAIKTELFLQQQKIIQHYPLSLFFNSSTVTDHVLTKSEKILETRMQISQALAAIAVQSRYSMYETLFQVDKTTRKCKGACDCTVQYSTSIVTLTH